MRRALLLALPATTMLLVGCGGEKQDAGARVFATAGCAQCHTLAAAKATARIGPNLDDLKPTEVAVERQVTHGGNGMPSFADQLSARQIRQVAAYVAKASRSGGRA
jgi:sulfite dehydrogenase